MWRVMAILVGVWAILPAAVGAVPIDVTAEQHPMPRELAGTQTAMRDTIWFGGDDGTGVAFEGGIWDWDTLAGDPLQGWIPRDETQNPAVYFYRVAPEDFSAHGDPCSPVTAGGMLWCGVHEDEANCRDFVAGMGYQNGMCQWARSPVLELVESPQATELRIEFFYFNDTEEGYDFTRVYLRCLTGGGDLLGESLLDSFTGIIGAPGALEAYTHLVPYSALASGTEAVQVEVRMIADGGWSDQDGLYNSVCGPFGLDDASVTMGTSLVAWNFDDGPQGWTFDRCPGAGTYMGVLAEEVWGPWLDYVGLTNCPLSANAWDFVDEEHSPFWPPSIPAETRQMAISGPIARGQYSPAIWDTVVVQWSSYLSQVCFRPGYMIYPYTTVACPTPRWSDRLGQTEWWVAGNPSCSRRDYNLVTLEGEPGEPIRAEWDSLRFVFEVYTFLTVQTQGSPLLDDVRVGLLGRSGSGVTEERRPGEAVTPLITGIRPNPFRSSTTIHLELPGAWTGSVSIHDLAGRRVCTLAHGALAAGEHHLVWNGRDDEGRLVEAGAFWVRTAEEGTGVIGKRLLIVE